MEQLFSKIPKLFLFIMNIALFLVGITLSVALIGTLVEILHQIYAVFMDTASYFNLIEEILSFFLYFEFVALVAKYFTNNFHFPLRYFLYIGITAVIRMLIVNHDTTWDTLILSGAILALVISLVLVAKYNTKE